MPSPKIAEGFYWVRIREEARSAYARGSAPFVAERMGDSWFQPGEVDTTADRDIELLSRDPLLPPSFDLQGKAVKVSTAAWPTTPKVPRIKRPRAAKGRSQGSKAPKG